MPRTSGRRRPRVAVTVAIACLAGVAGSARAAFDIQLIAGSSLANNAPALAAFNRAAAAWESRFTDNVTVFINADVTSTGFSSANIIGQTSSNYVGYAYDTVRNRLASDASNEPSNAIVAALPSYAQFSSNVQLPAGRTLSGNVFLTTANAKAAGFTVNGSSDATITFNSGFSFDYDNSNGVSPNAVDFETVATHEIAHALGFVSVVDEINAGETLVDPNPLDLYRFGGRVNAATFGPAQRELRPGVGAAFSDANVSYNLSTGVTSSEFPNTDGNQASHWEADEITRQYIGIMDPTLSAGMVSPITSADLRAFDLIGYDLANVPEPTVLAAVAGAAITLLRRRRRATA